MVADYIDLPEQAPRPLVPAASPPLQVAHEKSWERRGQIYMPTLLSLHTNSSSLAELVLPSAGGRCPF